MNVKIDKDILVLDTNSKILANRYLVVALAEDGLVDNDGFKTELGNTIAKEAMVENAKKHGAEVIGSSHCVYGGDIETYGDDAILAFNGGDLIMANEPLGQFLLFHDLATKD